LLRGYKAFVFFNNSFIFILLEFNFSCLDDGLSEVSDGFHGFSLLHFFNSFFENFFFEVHLLLGFVSFEELFGSVHDGKDFLGLYLAVDLGDDGRRTSYLEHWVLSTLTSSLTAFAKVVIFANSAFVENVSDAIGATARTGGVVLSRRRNHGSLENVVRHFLNLGEDVIEIVFFLSRFGFSLYKVFRNFCAFTSSTVVTISS